MRGEPSAEVTEGNRPLDNKDGATTSGEQPCCTANASPDVEDACAGRQSCLLSQGEGEAAAASVDLIEGGQIIDLQRRGFARGSEGSGDGIAESTRRRHGHSQSREGIGCSLKEGTGEDKCEDENGQEDDGNDEQMGESSAVS